MLGCCAWAIAIPIGCRCFGSLRRDAGLTGQGRISTLEEPRLPSEMWTGDAGDNQWTPQANIDFVEADAAVNGNADLELLDASWTLPRFKTVIS